MCVLVTQSCLTICDFMSCSQLGFSVHGNSPGKNTGLPFPSPGDLPDSGIEPMSPALQADSLLLNHQESPKCWILIIKCKE